VNDRADGNYMFGHALAAAFMGYASLGENSTAQEMIDFARIRFDGTPSNLLPSNYRPANHLDQVFGGGYTSTAAQTAISNGTSTAGLLGAPFKAGFDFQGWAYGSGTFERMIDYLVLVRAAGGPDFTQPGTASTDHWNWLDAILHGLKDAMLPNNFEVDTTGDWGGDVGVSSTPASRSGSRRRWRVSPTGLRPSTSTTRRSPSPRSPMSAACRPRRGRTSSTAIPSARRRRSRRPCSTRGSTSPTPTGRTSRATTPSRTS
jgi:hypothetical protein